MYSGLKAENAASWNRIAALALSRAQSMVYRMMMTSLIRMLLVALVLGAGVAASSVISPDVAIADDDGGDDGGGGGGADGGDGGGSTGGGDSGGGDSWQPFGKSAAPTQRLRCRCGGFLGLQCTCRMIRQRYSRPTPIASRRRSPEIVAAGLAAPDLAALGDRGFTNRGSRESTLLARSFTRLEIPPRTSLRRALQLARSVAPQASFAPNDIYRSARPVFRPAGRPCGQSCPAFQLTDWRADVGQCAARTTIGVIDTGVDREHPSLVSSRIETLTIRRNDRPPSDTANGTGVVSVLIGDASGEYAGAAPGARVIAVDAFHRGNAGDVSDTFDLVAALDVLVERRVRVINLSLSGPDNDILQAAIENVQQAGTVLIAAAGATQGGTRNGYPGRYPGVLAVTAVDGRLRSARSSQRGNHIAFAAPGVGISVANAKKGYSAVQGSSFAAPFVSAAYAIALESVADGDEATRLIAAAAKDLGAPGRDAVFGWGLIQFSALPPC